MVEGPPRQPHAGRLRDHRPRPQRGPRPRGADRPGPAAPDPPVLRRQGEARGDRERPRRAGRRRRRPVQRGAPPVPALRPREAPEEAVLRPPPADPGDLRGAGPRTGGEAPGRARPPPLRGTPPAGVDPQRGGRRASRVHGGGRVPRRRVPGDREAADPPDRGGARTRAEGAGPPPGRPEGPWLPPRLPRGVRERGEELDAERPHGGAGPRRGADVLDPVHDDPRGLRTEAGPPHGHRRLRGPGPVLDGGGVPLHVRGDLRERPRPPPLGRLGPGGRDPPEGPARGPDPPPAGPRGPDPARPHEDGPRPRGSARGRRPPPGGLRRPPAAEAAVHGHPRGEPRARGRGPGPGRVPPPEPRPAARAPAGPAGPEPALREFGGPPRRLRAPVHGGPRSVPAGGRGAARVDPAGRLPGVDRARGTP